MAFAFFQIPAEAVPEVAAPLNAFLRSHRIVRVTRQWCEAGRESAWAFCIEYLDGVVSPATRAPTARVDYREVLPPEQFEVFARLRTLRKTLAERDGQPRAVDETPTNRRWPVAATRRKGVSQRERRSPF